MKQKQATKILEGLCEVYGVPTMPITICKSLDGMQGFFNSTPYEIQIEKAANIKILYHEFSHYLITLLSKANKLEEDICYMTMEVMGKKISKNQPNLAKLIKKNGRNKKV